MWFRVLLVIKEQMDVMANDKRFRLTTTLVGTRGVKEYRATIPVWVNETDVVLEIGCEWGTTTTIIA